jgi:hypothetical protein
MKRTFLLPARLSKRCSSIGVHCLGDTERFWAKPSFLARQRDPVGGREKLGSHIKSLIPLQNPSVLKSADFGGDQKCLLTSRRCAVGQMCAKTFSTVLVESRRVGFCSRIKSFCQEKTHVPSQVDLFFFTPRCGRRRPGLEQPTA